MPSIKIYLDKRRARIDETYPLKLVVAHRSQTALISLPISVKESEWNKMTQQVVKHTMRVRYNHHLAMMRTKAEMAMLTLVEEGALADMSITDIKKAIEREVYPERTRSALELMPYWDKVVGRKNALNTREMYNDTKNVIESFAKDKKLYLNDITYSWLCDFEQYLIKRGLAQNSRVVRLSHVRNVILTAYKEDIISKNPFARFKFKLEETRKRSLPIDRLREFMQLKSNRKASQLAIDMYKLSFFLIGINPVDLFGAKRTQLIDGRLQYKRSKTGRFYDIKVEPEAMEIINRYPDDEYLINIGKHYKSSNSLISTIYQTFGKHDMQDWKGLSIYWMRHSWATTAAQLDIPKDTISHALGHAMGNATTAIYIDFNKQKIDEANRRVIDFVLYNKV